MKRYNGTMVVSILVEHDGQSWYWTQRWQVEEREVDEWKANGSRSSSMEVEESLSIISRIIEKGDQPDKYNEKTIGHDGYLLSQYAISSGHH